MRVHDFFDYWAREQPGTEFAVAGDRSLTYDAAATIADRLAGRLAASGCAKGDRVAVLARNAPWYLLLYFAAANAGVVLVPLNRRLAPREWAEILADAEPRVLIAGAAEAAAVDVIRGDVRGIAHFVAEGAPDGGAWERHAAGAPCSATGR